MSQNQEVPGLILSAQYNGATVFCEGYGLTQEGGSTPTISTSFQIDSLTKALTAMAVLRLYEQGTIQDINDTVGAYMTSLPNCDNCNWCNAWNSITIKQLLAMVSGIPDTNSGTQTYLQILSGMDCKKMSTPGVKYLYSDPNYFLLGALVDTLTASFPSPGYPAYIQTEVLDVLGMPNTGLILQSAEPNPALPYFNNAYGAWRNPYCGYSSGGFASTMSDLEAFALGLANGLVLQPATYQLMWTPYEFANETYGPFGLGWSVTNNPDGSLNKVLKDGGGWGWSSALGYSPVNAVGSSLAASACVLMNGATNQKGAADGLVSQIISLVIKANG
jgi:CubicO group peptidase (beta-lactamase class C family)